MPARLQRQHRRGGASSTSAEGNSLRHAGSQHSPPVCKQCQLRAARFAAERASGAARGHGTPGHAPGMGNRPLSARLRAGVSARGAASWGRERRTVRFSDQGQTITHWSRASRAVFCQELAPQMFPVLFLPRFQLVGCPLLVFAFTVKFHARQSPRGRRRWICCPLYRLCT